MNMNQVTLASSDIEASKRFYLTLGFILIVDTPHYLRFACSEEGATFSLVAADHASKGVSLYFEEEKLDDKVSELIARGIQFEQEPEDKPYLWREAVLRDPSGNKLVLYWAGENRLNPPWRVKNQMHM